MQIPVPSSLSPALLSAIEDAGINASATSQQRWLDGWLVRFDPGKIKRARCVNAFGEGMQPLREKLNACQAIFKAARLPMIFRITPFSRPETLDGFLAEAGMSRFDDTRVWVLSDLAGLGDDALASRPDLTVAAVDLQTFSERVGEFRGSPAAARLAQAQRLRASPVPFFAFELRQADVPVACGQYALENGLAGLYDIFTVPAARGKGLAQVLCTHLLIQARAQGARHAYLQVEGNNHAALAAYRRLGFSEGYSYHYRAHDPAAA